MENQMTEQALEARIRAALRLLGNEEITPTGRHILEKILDAERAARPAGPTPPCHNCGDTERTKASASRGGTTRYFCHDSEQSCYNDCRGGYFDDWS